MTIKEILEGNGRGLMCVGRRLYATVNYSYFMRGYCVTVRVLDSDALVMWLVFAEKEKRNAYRWAEKAVFGTIDPDEEWDEIGYV